MTYAEWKAAGCPPLLLSVKHVSEWCNISVMQANNYCKDGRLFRYPDGPSKSKIPTDDAKNLEWLLNRDGFEKNELQSPGRPTKQPAAPKAPRAPAAPRNKYVIEGDDEPVVYPCDVLDTELLLDALHNLDFSQISAQAVQKVARIETALKTRADREAKRGLLIERVLVSTVFARLYQVDTNELRTIGAKVAPDVAAELGVEDPETILKIEKRIDDEVLKVLSHIKRLMDDFLVGVGGEPVVES